MKLDTGEQRRVAAQPARRPKAPRPTATAHRPRRINRRLTIALALVIAAGFLLGLGLPIHG